MISIEQPPGEPARAALRFQYTKFYSDSKRPPGGEVTFEAHLGFEIESPRLIWLQQWVAGAFDYMDNSVLAAVVRGVSDLSIARVWVQPNRFRPLRLQLHINRPTLFFPRNVYALADQHELHKHSLRVDLDSLTSDSVLLYTALPGFEHLGPAFCEQLTLRFAGLRPSVLTDASQVGAALPSTPSPSPSDAGCAWAPLASSATDLVLKVTKSIERAHDQVPH